MPPRPYPPAYQDYAMLRLEANQGDVMRTSRELGISDRTLYKWRKKAGIIVSPLPPTPPTSDANTPDSVGTGRALSADSQGANALPPDDLQALRDLKAQMLELAAYIMADDRIKQAIDAAPLNQRIAALAQLIDRIIKLAAELPAPKDESWKLALLDEGDDEEEEDENDEDEY